MGGVFLKISEFDNKASINSWPLKPVADDKFFDVFLKDPHQKHIVVIGVSGNVDTTEVGIFFEEAGPSAIKVEISSLSSTAKRRVADAVFNALDKRFAETTRL